MPILGYFFYVGSALLALLFVADVYVPKQPPRDEAVQTYKISIAAAHPTSEPIVFSGETRDFGGPPPMSVVDATNHPPQMTQPAAQAIPAQTTVATQQETRPARRKVARRKVAPENSYGQIPDEWRSRYSYTGMAFARPLGW